jgi:hypothetical protein
MGKRYNMFAARLRIMENTFEEQGLGPSVQDISIDIHAYHCELLGRHVHFASHAACLARPHISPASYRWSRKAHQYAAND